MNTSSKLNSVFVASRTYQFGPFEVDTLAREVRKHGYRIRLSGQPLEVLLLLLERPGELVTREELCHRLWASDTFVDFDRSLNSAIKKLRIALEDQPQEPRFIETQARKGYRFIGPLTSVDPNPMPVAPTPASLESPVASVPTHLPPLVKASPWRRLLIIVFAAALVGGSLFWWLRIKRSNPAASVGGDQKVVVVRPAVAVLGFQNLSPRTDADWLSTAFTQMLTTELAVGQQLRTLPGENVTRAKRELKIQDRDGYSRNTLDALRRDLGTDFVLVGSYIVLGKQEASQIRLDLRLQDTKSGETLSSIAVSGKESEIFDLVARAGEEIRNRLGVQTSVEPTLAASRLGLPSNPEAIRLYSEGLANLRISENIQARDLLVRAVKVQPDFALAHAALAQAWSALGYDAKALAAAEHAVQLSKALPQDRRLEIEARYFEMKHDWPGAINVYRQLWTAHPDDLEVALSLVRVENTAGDNKAALEVVGALRNLPVPHRDDPRIDLAEAIVAAAQSDYKKQLQLAQQAANKAGAAGSELLLARAKLMEGWALDDLSELKDSLSAYQEAERIFAAAGDRDGTATALNDIGIVLQKQGDLAGAMQKLEAAQAEFRRVGNENGFAGALTNLGEVCRVRGDLVRAQALYRQAAEIFQKIGRIDNEHAAMNNLGSVLFQVGDFAGAHNIFEKVLREEQGTSDTDGLAFARNNMADVLRAQGRLAEAKTLYEQSLNTFREVGDRATAASVQLNLSRCLLLQGDFASATKMAEEALAANTAIDAKGDAAVDVLMLAKIAYEQGHPEKFDASTVAALDELRSEQRNDDVVEGTAMRVHGLLAQGNVPEAWRELSRVEGVPSSDRLAKFHLTIARAEAESARGQSKVARQRLATVLADATRMGCVSCQFEARYALFKVNQGSHPGIETQLSREARSAGFNLIASKVSVRN